MRIILITIFPLVFSGCTSTPRDYAPCKKIDVTKIHNAKPKAQAKSKYGNPYTYTVYGKRYHVLPSSKNYHATGIASWYGMKFHHQLTSDHETYDVYKMTAAHKTLPIPCYAKVTNLKNGKHVIVKINDRGPFAENRLIDLSYAAAKKLDIIAHGTGLVHIDTITPNTKNPTRTAEPQIFLQTGAFSHLDNAIEMQQKINRKITTPCKIIDNPNHHLHLIEIGPIKNATIAHNITSKLASMGINHPVTIAK